MKMKKELLAAVAAAALIATTGGVTAQVKMEKETGAQGGAKVETQGQKPGAKVQGQGGAKVQGQGGAQMQTEGGAKTEGQGGAKTGTQTQTQGGAKTESSQQSAQPGAADKPVQLSSEQRTKISTTLQQKDVNLKRVERTSINFNINVGAVVPRTIGLVPLPAPIIAVVPAFRGYLYIVVGDDLLIIHPRTYEIVAVIPA
jgi:hypothetical protein